MHKCCFTYAVLSLAWVWYASHYTAMSVQYFMTVSRFGGTIFEWGLKRLSYDEGELDASKLQFRMNMLMMELFTWPSDVLRPPKRYSRPGPIYCIVLIFAADHSPSTDPWGLSLHRKLGNSHVPRSRRMWNYRASLTRLFSALKSMHGGRPDKLLRYNDPYRSSEKYPTPRSGF